MNNSYLNEPPDVLMASSVGDSRAPITCRFISVNLVSQGWVLPHEVVQSRRNGDYMRLNLTIDFRPSEPFKVRRQYTVASYSPQDYLSGEAELGRQNQSSQDFSLIFIEINTFYFFNCSTDYLIQFKAN